MRLPQPLLDSQFFIFERLVELERAVGEYSDDSEIAEIRRLAALGLPPVASVGTLATLLGINQGLVWSFVNKTRRHYRTFFIPKGRRSRRIDAPRVALKVPQTWLAAQLASLYECPDHVFGFVRGRSHVDAALMHAGARWVLSIDISDFFPSTPQPLVVVALEAKGYGSEGAGLIGSLACLDGFLAQGAPTSPVLSNMCFASVDVELALLAERDHVRMTRYADDIIFSGTNDCPDGLEDRIRELFVETPWKVSEEKVSFVVAPARLKVHGLVVNDRGVRLTRGYRNRIRAYRHLIATRPEMEKKFNEVARGHVAYASYVESRLAASSV